MSAALIQPFAAGTEGLPRKRFTREDVARLEAAGVLDGQRYELLDGDLIDKSGQNPLHIEALQLLLAAFVRLVDAMLIRVQVPMEAAVGDQDRSLPQPDIAILAARKPEFAKRFARGDEMRLVVEVSDTSIAFDLNRKATLYAAAGVPEYWVLDLGRRLLIAHRQPEGGLYRMQQVLSEGNTVLSEGLGQKLAVADLFPVA